ncbi:hypothetical protein EDC04DRAFT_2642364 [Pisolithus marmoratus]|nr:hypothetical protein EDC04DRAFT_2642364 [Pisolithus marmoratus]
MPHPDEFIPPPPPQPVDLPTPVMGRSTVIPTPAIGEHMTLPDENDMDFHQVPYVPHRMGPKKRFVGGFINTLKRFPVFGKRKNLRRRSYENVQAPTPILESQLEEESELEDERGVMPQPSEPGLEPGRVVASSLVQSPDPVAQMPGPSASYSATQVYSGNLSSIGTPAMGQIPIPIERSAAPSVSYPATQVHSGNISSIGTPAMGPNPIPIQRSAAPSPADLQQAFSMMDDDDNRSLSEEDGDVGMPYISPPRTSTPVHRHRHPRPSTPAPFPYVAPPYDPVIPPPIGTMGPSQMISSSSRLYDPSGRAHSPHNTTFLSQLARFKRFVHGVDQLPFSSGDQIADEYVPSQTHRSKTREQKREHMISPSWYNSREPTPQAFIYTNPVLGFGAVPALDVIPPPVHKPVPWGQPWDPLAPGRLWDTMPPPPLGAPGGAPGMVEVNSGLGPSVPYGYAPDRQPVFVYPSAGRFVAPAATPSRW